MYMYESALMLARFFVIPKEVLIATNQKTCPLITFLLQCPDFGCDFIKIIQRILRIRFIIFPSSRSKSEHFVTKIIRGQV